MGWSGGARPGGGGGAAATGWTARAAGAPRLRPAGAPLDAGWSFVPYLIVAVALVAICGMALRRIRRAPDG